MMSTVLTRDEVRELLPAYALGSLDVDERTAVDDGLARFPDMRAELAKYRTVAVGLAATVPQRVPPTELKAAILTRAQARARPQAATRPTWWQRIIDSLSASGLATRLAFAALVLTAGLTLTQLIRTLPAGAEQLAQQQRIQSILVSGTEMVHLDGTQQIPDAWAVIRFNKGEKEAAMRVGHLPSLPQAQAYQLWLVNADGKRWSGALFNTSATGGSLVLVNCPQPMESIVRFGVSIEPANGSPAPTGPGALRMNS